MLLQRMLPPSLDPSPLGRTCYIKPSILALLSSKQEEEATTEALQGVSQRAVSLQIDLHNHKLLTAQHTRENGQREIARMKCLEVAHAGDWLFHSFIHSLFI